MHDFLDKLAQTAKESINGAYCEGMTPATAVSASLKQTILQSTTAAVITEVKGASPSKGTIKKNFAPDEIAKAMARGGAVGISVLTEPKHFCGSLGYLAKVREAVNLPLLMKDIIVSPIQLDAAVQAGANAVLFIQALFDRGYCECDVSGMIAEAHRRKLEVLLETHTKEEFNRAVESAADLVGVNNRDLRTLTVDLKVTRDILIDRVANGRIIVSESGINSATDVLFLRGCGAKAFLVGSAVMLADDVEAKVMELVQAHEKATNHQ
jgi:indole-3-glycerol phosphate synthase